MSCGKAYFPNDITVTKTKYSFHLVKCDGFLNPHHVLVELRRLPEKIKDEIFFHLFILLKVKKSFNVKSTLPRDFRCFACVLNEGSNQSESIKVLSRPIESEFKPLFLGGEPIQG